MYVVSLNPRLFLFGGWGKRELGTHCLHMHQNFWKIFHKGVQLLLVYIWLVHIYGNVW